MLYEAELYVTLQKTLYVALGPPNAGGFLEPAAILATLLLALVLRKRKRAFWLGAGFALLLALSSGIIHPCGPSKRSLSRSAPKLNPWYLDEFTRKLGNRPCNPVCPPDAGAKLAHSLGIA
jgi:hypothetical protein